jgi:hypothetical protein
MSALLDDISRITASPISRREAFKLVGGAVGGALLAYLGVGRASRGLGAPAGGAQAPQIIPRCPRGEFRCGATCCRNGLACCNGKCCTSGQTCCNDTCCPRGQCCNGRTCCPSGQRCINGRCCPSAQSCNGFLGIFGVICCASGQTCCDGRCCPSGQCCNHGERCCPTGYVCCGGARCVKATPSGSSPCVA